MNECRRQAKDILMVFGRSDLREDCHLGFVMSWLTGVDESDALEKTKARLGEELGCPSQWLRYHSDQTLSKARHHSLRLIRCRRRPAVTSSERLQRLISNTSDCSYVIITEKDFGRVKHQTMK